MAYRIYIASSAMNRAFVAVLADWLSTLQIPDADIEVVGDWWRCGPIESVHERAVMDFKKGIDEADLVLACYPYGPGTTSEVGYQLGRGLPVVYYCTEWDREDDPLIVGLIEAQDNLHSGVVHGVDQLRAFMHDWFGRSETDVQSACHRAQHGIVRP